MGSLNFRTTYTRWNFRPHRFTMLIDRLTSRIIGPTTRTRLVAEPSARLEFPATPLAVAVRTFVPARVGRRTMVSLAASPGQIVPRSMANLRPGEAKRPRLAEAETRVAPAGRTPVRATPTAGPGPQFATVIV